VASPLHVSLICCSRWPLLWCRRPHAFEVAYSVSLHGGVPGWAVCCVILLPLSALLPLLVL
jgi:hypothetical protein